MFNLRQSITNFFANLFLTDQDRSQIREKGREIMRDGLKEFYGGMNEEFARLTDQREAEFTGQQVIEGEFEYAETPDETWTKAELIEAAGERGVTVKQSMRKAEILELLQES